MFHPTHKMHSRQNANNRKKNLEQVQDGGCRRTTDGRRDPYLVKLTSDEPNSS
jgi:hypothetical protein